MGHEIEESKQKLLTTPPTQNIICVITWSRIATKITDIEFLNLSQYVPRNAYVHIPEILGTCYGTDTEQICTYSWKLLTVLLDKYDVLTTNSQWILVIPRVNFLYLETYSRHTLICSAEHLWKRLLEIPQKWFRKQLRNTNKFCLVSWG